jgi:hypothetical protein
VSDIEKYTGVPWQTDTLRFGSKQRIDSLAVQRAPTMEGNTTFSFPNYTYWDYADGDAMVCSSRGPPRYRAMCNYNQYFIGIELIICGLWFLWNARRLDRVRATTVAPVSVREIALKQRKKAAQRSQFRRHNLVFGTEMIALGATHLINGSDTIYPTSTVPGLLGDLAACISVTLILYHLLLLMRSAQAFRRLVQIPTDSPGERRTRIGLNRVLDIAQSTGGFAMTFVLWALLASGVLTRPVFLSGLYVLMTATGVRTMFENIIDRMRTILRVNELQQKAGGDLAAKRRRRRILKSKIRVLVFDTTGLTPVIVLLPMSVLIFGTFESSTQILFHIGACDTITSTFVVMACVQRHKYVSKHLSRHAIDAMATTKAMSLQGTGSRSVADESGMSVVDASEIEGAPKNQGGGGLFSDVESTRV